MDLKKSNMLIIYIIIFAFSTPVFSETQGKYNFHLPETIKNWSLSDKPDIFIGDDLFQHINGGADIYHEYGFRRVISGTYKNKNNKTINAEIYEMKTLDAAYGIYSFKTSKTGKSVNINGCPGKFEDYYLNFLSGVYKVTLVGFDTKKETKMGILKIAETLSKTLPKSPNIPPRISSTLNVIKDKPLHTKYISGELSLFNIYKFSDQNLFTPKEGVAGYYKNTKVIVIRYKNKSESIRIYNKSASYYKKTFPDSFKKSQGIFSVIDSKGNEICIKPFNNLIYIYLGKKTEKKPVFFHKGVAH